MSLTMKENKYSKAFHTMITVGLAFVVNYGINLVLTPYITESLGTEAYGFVSLAKQFAQYATIITTALDSFAARYITIAYHTGNKKEANRFFSSAFFGDVVLASGVMAAAVFCILFLERLLNISGNIVNDVKILFLFVFINFWITTVFTVFSSSAYIENKLDMTGIFKGLSYITEGVVLYVLYVLFPDRIFYVGVGLIFASIVVALSNVWICRKYTPDLNIRKKNYSGQAVKRLVINGIWTSVNSVGELLNNGLDLIVCNLMLSPLAMGQLAIAKTIGTIFQSLYAVVAQAFQPMFLKSYAENNRKVLLQELKRSMKISGMLANIGFAGFVALGLVYYRLWIPNEDIQLVYRLTVITIMVSIASGPMQPLYYIYTLTVKKMVPCFVTIAGGLFNVAGMYLLINYAGMGVYAVAWTTVGVMAVINFGTNPLYMAHVLHLPWHTFYPNIIRNVASCAVMVLLFKGLSALWLPDSWLTLALSVPFYAAAGAVVHLCIVCEKNDWHEIRTWLLRHGGRKK